jgi:enterochelin esterase-like enzyme
MPGDPSNVLIPTSQPGTWSRSISVYVPAHLPPGRKAPLLVVGDGGLFDTTIFTVLDNLIHQRKLPAMVAVTIQAGGQDAQGSQRGFEYDAVVSDRRNPATSESA